MDESARQNLQTKPDLHPGKFRRDAQLGIFDSKVSPANLLEGFGVSTVFVAQLSVMHIVDFNEI